MNRFVAVVTLALASFAVVACSDSGDDTSSSSSSSSSGSSSSTTTEKYSCSLNGVCYKCPSSEAVSDCLKTGGAGCTSTDSSYCE